MYKQREEDKAIHLSESLKNPERVGQLVSTLLERIVENEGEKDVNHFMLFTLGYGVQIVRGAVNFTNSVGTETCFCKGFS